MSAPSPLRRRSSLGGPTARTGILPPSLGTTSSAGSSSSLLGTGSPAGAAQSLPTSFGPAVGTVLPSPPSAPTHVIPAPHAPAAFTPLALPDAFAQVEPGIFRSSLPTAASIPFLRTLALKSIVLLTPEAPSRAVAAWLDEASVQVVHLGAARWGGGGAAGGTGGAGGGGTPPNGPGLMPFTSGIVSPAAAPGSATAAPSNSANTPPAPTWRPVSEDLIKDALEHILRPASHPVLIACTTGIHETGTVVGCLRRMQRWNFNAIAFEYRSFADTKARYAAEQMIELWDVDWVVVPKGAGERVVGLVCAGEEEEEEEHELRDGPGRVPS